MHDYTLMWRAEHNILSQNTVTSVQAQCVCLKHTYTVHEASNLSQGKKKVDAISVDVNAQNIGNLPQDWVKMQTKIEKSNVVHSKQSYPRKDSIYRR